jgi:CDP-diacylglycerol--serine O-phosphatidyltransferase
MGPKKLTLALPSLITAGSIFCGFFAVTLCAGQPTPDDLTRAAYFIITAFALDVLDGRVARLLRAQSVFGVELDSLADVISFGIAPALLVHQWALEPLGWGGTLVAFLFLLCGALRLARFNALAHGPGGHGGASPYFQGLPIPLAAGTIVSVVIVQGGQARVLDGSLRLVVAAGVLALAGLMISRVRYRTFKGTRLDGASVAIAGGIVAAAITVGVVLGPTYIFPLSFLAYVAGGMVVR